MSTTTSTIKKSKSASKQKRPEALKQNIKLIKEITQVFPVSHCGLHYAAALVSPFHIRHGVCIPSGMFPLPSQKASATRKGTFTIGLDGVGFVLINPSPASDQISLKWTTSISSGVQSAPFSTFTGQATGNFDALPFNSIDLSGMAVHSRVVATALRAKYSGQLAGRNGDAVIYEDPDHRSIMSQSFDSLMGQQQSSIIDVTNWTQMPGEEPWMAELSYSGPIKPNDVEFTNGYWPVGSDTGSDGFMGIAVRGRPGDTWTFDAIIHAEYIGSKTTERTPSHTDPTVFAKAVEVAKSLTANGPLTSATSSGFFSSLAKAIQANMPVLKNGAQMVKAAVTMDLGGVLAKGVQMLGAAGKVISADLAGGYRPTTGYLAPPPNRPQLTYK